MAYKELVRPVLEYGNVSRDPPTITLQEELEKVKQEVQEDLYRSTGMRTYDL